MLDKTSFKVLFSLTHLGWFGGTALDFGVCFSLKF